jgi:phospholipase/carboxylesterase
MKFLTIFLALFSSMNTINRSSYIKGDETLLHYIYRDAKEKSEKPPLLILLHGVGSNEQDLFSFADKLPARVFSGFG